VAADVGVISRDDVLCSTQAVIVGFNTKQEKGRYALAKHHGVTIETFGSSTSSATA